MGTNIKEQILKGTKFSIDGEEGFFTKKIGKVVLLYKREGFDSQYRGEISDFEEKQSLIVINYVGNKLFDLEIKLNTIKII